MEHDIDLIPDSYRERLKIQRWCHVFCIVMLAVALATFSLRYIVVSKNAKIQSTIKTLQRDKSVTLKRQQQYNDLLATERRLQKNLEILNGLRGGPAVRRIMQAMDRVLNGSVWFLRWSFKRAGEIEEVRPETVQTGYFIIIPQDIASNGKQQAWKLNTHMEIRGQARDHMSFSKFVQDLLKQPEIADVKVVNTSVRRYVNTEVIDFNVIVAINDQGG